MALSRNLACIKNQYTSELSLMHKYHFGSPRSPRRFRPKGDLEALPAKRKFLAANMIGPDC